MFERLGRVVYRLRYLIVVAWLALAAAAAVLAPSLTEVGSADQASFLPRQAESMVAQRALDAAFPDEASAGIATVAFSREGGLTDDDRAYIGNVATWITGPDAPPEVAGIVTGVLDAADHPELASMLRSADGELELLQVQLSVTAFQPEASAVVDPLRAHLASTVPAGLTANVTGSVGIGADYLNAIVTATDRTTIVTVVLVILVLLLIYRAPFAALVPLLTIGASYLVASGLLALLAQAGWQISSLLGTFVVVLVFGVGTDYTIFLVSRFREEVAGAAWDEAVTATVRRIGAVIAASAATVVIGLGSMVVGEFGMFQTTGPALAIAILVTLAAGLTLTPALLAIFGHWLFWPRHEHDVSDADRGFFARLAGLISRRPGAVAIVVFVALAVPALGSTGLRQSFDILADLPDGSDAKTGFEIVARHFDEGRLLPMTIVVEGGPDTSFVSPDSLARLRDLGTTLTGIDGVAAVQSVISPSGDGTVPDGFRPSVQLASMAQQFAVPQDPANALKKLLDPATAKGLRSAAEYVGALRSAFPDVAGGDEITGVLDDLTRMPDAIDQLRAGGATAELQALIAAIGSRLPGELDALSTVFARLPNDVFIPAGTGDAAGAVDQALAAYVSADRQVTRLYAIAADDPYSSAAFATVDRVRAAVAGATASFGPGTQLLVGGQTAAEVDLKATINSDFVRVAGLTVLGVLVVLMLLLRSIVAPIYLVATVLLSYLCTLGLTSTFFEQVLGQAGVNDFLPLMVFVLLVAIGSDYNIFLMSRVREESDARGTRPGIRAASARTGAVITSAGIILAGTFAAMVTAPLTVLFQAGVIVAVGVLIDTFVVRSLLVPAITTLLGDAAWWPFGRGRAGGGRSHPAGATGADGAGSR